MTDGRRRTGLGRYGWHSGHGGSFLPLQGLPLQLSSRFRFSESLAHLCRSRQSYICSPLFRAFVAHSVRSVRFCIGLRRICISLSALSERSNVGPRTDTRAASAQKLHQGPAHSLAVRRCVRSYAEVSRAIHLSLESVQLRQGLALPGIMNLSLAGLHRPSKYTMRVFRTTLFVSLAAGLFG